MQETLTTVPLDDIEPTDSVQVEKKFLANLEQYGQQQNVVLFHAPADADWTYIIAEGSRRIAGYRQIQRDHINAIIKTGDETDIAKITLSCNGHRRPNIARECEACGVLADRGLTPEEIATETQLSVREIKNRLDILRGLPPELFERLRKGEVSYKSALRCLKLSPERRETLGKLERVTLQEVDAQIRDMNRSMIDIDSIPTPSLEGEGYIADQVEAAALQEAGRDRKVLLQAAFILRKRAKKAA